MDTAQLEAETLQAALAEQPSTGRRIGETLIRLGAVTGEQVASALATQLGLEHVTGPLTPSREALRAVRAGLARQHRVVPLAVSHRTLRVAMADPLDLNAVDDLRFQTGRRIEAAVADADAVSDALELHYVGDGVAGGDWVEGAGVDGAPDGGVQDLVAALPRELRIDEGSQDTSLERATRAAPVVRLVDSLIRSAVAAGASDIHVEETGGDVRIRHRVDGILQRVADLPAAARHAVLSRIKVMAGMDISVKRRAQDGSIDLEHIGRRLNLRVSTLPVNGGEKAVVRILDPGAAPPNLGALGLAEKDLDGLRRLVLCGEGVILVAGPTGSGKSTTIFAALSELDREKQNVVTLEDPVEYRLPGANQTQVDRRAGLGFADALRAVLRQDPDVVMIGEIRDPETAEIAMAAAVTGHLVLSTIHTTDAPGAVTRLLNMGVPAFLVAGGLSGVVAQRLVRRVCRECRGAACEACSDGHRGRTGVFQVLTLTDPLRDAISRGEPSARIRQLAAEAGMGTLGNDARRALAEGLTTPHEIMRLLQASSGATLPCAACGTGVPLGAPACPGCGHQRERVCGCGRTLDGGWRFCPWCVRPAAG